MISSTSTSSQQISRWRWGPRKRDTLNWPCTSLQPMTVWLPGFYNLGSTHRCRRPWLKQIGSSSHFPSTQVWGKGCQLRLRVLKERLLMTGLSSLTSLTSNSPSRSSKTQTRFFMGLKSSAHSSKIIRMQSSLFWRTSPIETRFWPLSISSCRNFWFKMTSNLFQSSVCSSISSRSPSLFYSLLPSKRK